MIYGGYGVEHYLEYIDMKYGRRKAKNILLMAIPKEHMRRFHGMDDAKEIWEAIRTRFGGNANSKKMQKAVFKQQFEAFKISNSEGLEKGYDRFQQLLVKFEVLLVLEVLRQEIQGASKTSSSAQNVAFVSQSKSSTNKVKSGFSGAYSSCTPSTSSTNIPEKSSLLVLLMKMKKFYKKTGRRVLVDGKTPVGFDKKKLRMFQLSQHWSFAKECSQMGTHDGKKRRENQFINIKRSWKIEMKSDGKGPQKPEISVVSDNYSKHFTVNQLAHVNDLWKIPSEHLFETESESLSEPNAILSKSRLKQPLKDKETHKVNRKNWNDMMERELGEGYSFTKKKCFVCGSLNHLIKDCDYYEKKMAREAEVKRVVNTGNRVAKSVWTNANRVNHANQFVPRSVQLNTGRPKLNSVRPNINTGRTNINSVSPKVNTVRSKQPVPNKTSNSSSPKRPQMNQMNQRRDFSKSYSSVRRPFANSTAQMANSNAVMGRWGSAVKTSASYTWRNSRPNFNYNSGPTSIKSEHPLKNMVDRGIFDSGCSGHMTGNKDQLEDFEEFNGGSVTFGGSKGYISGTSQTPKSNASKEKDEDVELIVVSSAVMIPKEIVDSRTSSTKSKTEKILTDPQQEEKVSSTDTVEDNPKIQAFRRELEQIALNHLGTVPENNSTSTPSVNTGS
ncbi:hypothetical protein Tco_0531021 [Tanacetum coccineum]